jgi:phosphoribosylamine--glycine ligase
MFVKSALVIGSGGREHALVWKLKQSKHINNIYCAPGNAGIAQIAKIVDIKAEDIKSLADFAEKNKIDLTVVGPETPLVMGIVDEFEKRNLKIFGPSKEAAKLEGSKVFAKQFMKDSKIPSANFEIIDDSENAKDYVNKIRMPIVVKADGLAAGKGVIICKNVQEAFDAIDKIMTKKKFGESGNKLVVEEYLKGEEASILVITDGKDFVTLLPSQDHKQILDNDRGPNTGGMGAYAPASLIDEEMNERIENEIIKPTIRLAPK